MDRTLIGRCHHFILTPREVPHPGNNAYSREFKADDVNLCSLVDEHEGSHLEVYVSGNLLQCELVTGDNSTPITKRQRNVILLAPGDHIEMQWIDDYWGDE
jgi:hypothetical protein